MSEFHRMITYLYLYEQGIKSRNIGFAKAEKRDQRCLFEVHMKNTGYSLSPVQVYFYVQKGPQLIGISLGKFTLNRGSGEFKTILNPEDIENSGYLLDDVKGIYIPLSERTMLVSQWDDDEFKRESFVDLAVLSDDDKSELSETDSSDSAREAISPQPQNNSETQAANASPVTEHTSEAQAAETSFLPQNTSEIPVPESSQTAQDTPETATADVSDLADNPMHSQSGEPSPPKSEEPLHAAETPAPKTTAKTRDALKAVEALPLPERRTAGFHTVGKKPRPAQTNHAPRQEADSGHSKSETPEDWHLRWRFILENFPVMTPFSGDEHTLCVRLELKDIRQLPRQFWYFGNNSFLLHGFFNYRYIILGMTEEFGVKKWFIGVPGVFQNPERVMAALFGFPEFRSEKPSEINTGQFGYWYRFLNELSQPSEKTPD